MDQLSTLTTRTQLQRIHIRSQSLRVVLSPPPPQFHKHIRGGEKKAESKHAQGVKSLYFNGLAFGITNVISQGSYFLINHPDEYSY